MESIILYFFTFVNSNKILNVNTLLICLLRKNIKYVQKYVDFD